MGGSPGQRGSFWKPQGSLQTLSTPLLSTEIRPSSQRGGVVSGSRGSSPSAHNLAITCPCLCTRIGIDMGNHQSTIMYCIQNNHIHSSGTTAPITKAFNRKVFNMSISEFERFKNVVRFEAPAKSCRDTTKASPRRVPAHIPGKYSGLEGCGSG